MKILAINNYDLELAYKEPGNMPMHQTWGVSYLRDLGHKVDTISFTQKGKLKLLFFQLSLLKKVNQYDVVISFCSPYIYVLAYLKSIGLVKSKLFTFVHHHGRGVYLSRWFDGLIYLSKNIKEIDDKLYGLQNSYLIDWSPDLAFYEKTYQRMQANSDERYQNPVFVSTGKSHRNHHMLQVACNELHCKALIFDKNVVDDQYVSHEIPRGYHDMLKKISTSTIHIVPCENREFDSSLCGLTSVIDGLALGMPLLMSDNTNISFDIEKEGFGIYYKADDLIDLKNKMEYMLSHPEELEAMGHKARIFALKHDYNEYCKKLLSIISA